MVVKSWKKYSETNNKIFRKNFYTQKIQLSRISISILIHRNTKHSQISVECVLDYSIQYFMFPLRRRQPKKYIKARKMNLENYKFNSYSHRIWCSFISSAAELFVPKKIDKSLQFTFRRFNDLVLSFLISTFMPSSSLYVNREHHVVRTIGIVSNNETKTLSDLKNPYNFTLCYAT